MNTKNPFINTRIEFHILQSFPVTCLNRDDVGAPKTAIVGGTTRARVSSQCWKRQVRMEMNKFGLPYGKRTRLIAELIKQECISEGATEEQAESCGQKIAQIFIKDKSKGKSKKNRKEAEPENEQLDEESQQKSEDKDNDTLIFLSPKEVSVLAKKFKKVAFSVDDVITQKDQKKQAKELEKILDSEPNSMNAVDIALFGRMLAKAPSMNIEAASSFSHAISTHKVANEVEFFTALDDIQEEPGAGHIGSLEFNSATYYRYISLDLGQLWKTLQGHAFPDAIENFVKALFIAIPSARQATQSGASPWEFAKIYIRKGQRLQIPFETAVKAKDGGYLQESIFTLKAYLEKKEKLFGTLFGKIKEWSFGEDESFSIDNLISSLREYVSEKVSV